jgi:two-component system OmpR family response regulator
LNQVTRQAGRLLVLDQDTRLSQMLVDYFTSQNYQVIAVSDSQAMLKSLQEMEIDLILLDVVLSGGEDGFRLVREVRASSEVPVIILTARSDVVDRVVGLELGADDYITKPFHLREVLARVKTVLRRRQKETSHQTAVSEVIRFDGWQLDLGRRQLRNPSGDELGLTTGEFDMLTVLAKHPGRVLTREILMELTHGRTLDAFDRTIDAQIARLRKKIEPETKNPTLIRSVRGVGYVFTGKLAS